MSNGQRRRRHRRINSSGDPVLSLGESVRGISTLSTNLLVLEVLDNIP